MAVREPPRLNTNLNLSIEKIIGEEITSKEKEKEWRILKKTNGSFQEEEKNRTQCLIKVDS